MADETVQVGKYTLESLTTGMYSDPKIVYREYIQNSVDSLENAVSTGLIEPQSMRIDIVVNAEDSFISIRDNGTGIPTADAQKTLMNVGSSKKRNSNNRGFRGIGRLGGMSYCNTLVFTTSAETEAVKTIISFDCKRLRRLLVPGQYEDMSLSAVLEEITKVEVLPEKVEKHYFCVEMKEVTGFSDLLDIEAAKSYISQVAPLPYQSRHFIYTSQLKAYLQEKGYTVEEFPIFVGENESDLEPVYKPNKSRFRSDRGKRTVDEITSMSYFDIVIDGELYALGWYGNCGWYGFLSDKELAGFRVRKGNILIGDSKTMNVIFKEARFNGWTQGEIFIVTDKLIPNARRDDFEQNDAYYKLIEALSSKIGSEISRTIREASQTRNNPSAKALCEVEKKLAEATTTLTEGFNSAVDKEKLISSLTETAESLFDFAELKLLIDAVESSKFITVEKCTSLVSKLASLAGAKRAAELKRNVRVEGENKPENESVYHIVDIINNAINAGRKISFQYFQYNVRKEHKLIRNGEPFILTPLHLVWNGDYYYVVGVFDYKQEIGSFRVDRIAQCPVILDDPALAPPADFDINEYLNTAFRMYNSDQCNVELICDNSVMDSIIDRFGADVTTYANDMTSFRAIVHVATSHIFYSWVFSFGGLVRIKGPVEVKNAYAEMVKVAAKEIVNEFQEQ